MNNTRFAELLFDPHTDLTPDLESKLKAFIQQALQASLCTCSSQTMELLDRAWQVQRLLWQLRSNSIS